MDKINGAINYEYQILRYRQDAVSGEFVNIGIVFFDVDNSFLFVRVTEKQERIAHFFGTISRGFLLKTIRHIENEFNRIEKQLRIVQNLNYKSITEITASVLPINDNGLFFSDVHKGWHFDAQKAFDDTYYRLVGKYNGENAEPQRLQTSNSNAMRQEEEQPQKVLINV